MALDCNLLLAESGGPTRMIDAVDWKCQQGSISVPFSIYILFIYLFIYKKKSRGDLTNYRHDDEEVKRLPTSGVSHIPDATNKKKRKKKKMATTTKVRNLIRASILTSLFSFYIFLLEWEKKKSGLSALYCWDPVEYHIRMTGVYYKLYSRRRI